MKRLTAEWVRKAEADVRAARRLAQERPRLNDQVCFHCQQAMEKYLKALMQELGEPVPKTHEIKELLVALLPHDPTLRPFRRRLNGLTQYAVDYRYPGRHATTKQAESALQFVERVLGRCAGG